MRMIQLVRGANTLNTTYTYYPWNQQGGRLKILATGSLQNYTYAYDAVGNITSIADSVNSQTQTFGYDTLDRLTSAQASGASTGAYNETYTYNAATGNLASKESTVTPPNPGVSGLAAWWSLNETLGQRNDSQGANHLSPTGKLGYAVGRQGNAASFNPAYPSVLTHADNTQLRSGEMSFTLFAHFYLNSAGGTGVLINKDSDYSLRYSASALTFSMGQGKNSLTVTSPTFSAGSWHTVAAWYDSALHTLNIQIDNGTVTSVSYGGNAGATPITSPLSIGAYTNSTSVFNGLLDEVALYKRVLNVNERTWLYNSGMGRAYSEVDVAPTYTYTYGDASHEHAVTHLSNGNSYFYDANGNMTTRHVGTQTFNLAYDAENRLVSVTGAATASFTYDGDGKQVKSIVGGVTTYYVGRHYEKKGTTVTKYYFAGATRLAVRTNGTLSYLLGDHLGSSSVTTTANGVKTASALYKAFGETRFSSGNLGTDYKFIGQREQAELGLYFYGARWFDPSVGRFISPDTIVPTGTQGTQAWDRYAYVNNNPVRYTDPTGHFGIPTWLNPLSYNTLIVGAKFNLELFGGVSVRIGIALDLNALKAGQTPEGALLLSSAFTFGVEGEVGGMVTVSGTNDSVQELMNNNVSTPYDGSANYDASICLDICGGMGVTVDAYDPDGISAVEYAVFGVGEGVEAGMDIATASTWIAYQDSNGNITWNPNPLDVGELFDEAWNDLQNDAERYFQEY